MESAPEFYCLACEDVTIEGFAMRIWQYLCSPRNQNPSVIWVFNRITMTVLCNTDTVDGPAIRYSGGRSTSLRVCHDAPHLLVVPDIGSLLAYHTDMNGQVLAGSNTFGQGHLCLGDGFAPYDFSAVHLLCNYNANADLGWRGEALQIETPIQNNQRLVQTWPLAAPGTPPVQVPEQIRNFFNRS